MGFPKYQEDNFEIMEDRIRMKDGESGLTVKTTVKVTVTTPNSTPKTKAPTLNNPVLIESVCKCCGKKFSIKLKTARWYIERGMHLPKHCRKCLNARKSN